jgi:hypothetical protein
MLQKDASSFCRIFCGSGRRSCIHCRGPCISCGLRWNRASIIVGIGCRSSSLELKGESEHEDAFLLGGTLIDDEAYMLVGTVLHYDLVLIECILYILVVWVICCEMLLELFLGGLEVFEGELQPRDL